LVYRYILRDEFRFNDIINNLNQLKKTNKLEQIRELIPKFFDSDNYAMILVSGDVNDLGRMIKANRGVEVIFGYMPNELQGYKINKIMPKLFA
jgi:PAS domain-containing protein